MTPRSPLLRYLMLSGSEASQEIVRVLVDWYRVGLVEDAHLTFASDVDTGSGVTRAPAYRLSRLEAGDSTQDDFLELASRVLELDRIRSVMIHDGDSPDLPESEGTTYYLQYEAVRRALEMRAPRPVGPEHEEVLALRVLNLFIPYTDGPLFEAEAVSHVQAPGLLLAREDRSQPHGVAGSVRREGVYFSHAAAAAVTLTGMWRGAPLPDLERILLDVSDSPTQLRAFRQMVRIGRAQEPISSVVAEVARVMRGADPGMADLRVIRRGSATDDRLVDEAYRRLEEMDGRPFDAREPHLLDDHRSRLAHGYTSRFTFFRQEFGATFVASWRRLTDWWSRRKHDRLIGKDNPHRELAEQPDRPAIRLRELQRITDDVTQGRADALRDTIEPDIPPTVFEAIKREALTLVDGGKQATAGADAVKVVSDRAVIAPHPQDMPVTSAEFHDQVGIDISPDGFADQWALGGWIRLLDGGAHQSQPGAVEVEHAR